MAWFDTCDTCEDCFYWRYWSKADCYICGITDERIELHDEACDEFVPAAGLLF